MAARRTRTVRRTRTTVRRTRRARFTFVDRLLLAGCVAGAVYLASYEVLGVPAGVASVAGLAGFCFALGALVQMRTWPRWRSPLVWSWRARR